jgi:hypothetical protein
VSRASRALETRLLTVSELVIVFAGFGVFQDGPKTLQRSCHISDPPSDLRQTIECKNLQVPGAEFIEVLVKSTIHPLTTETKEFAEMNLIIWFGLGFLRGKFCNGLCELGGDDKLLHHPSL